MREKGKAGVEREGPSSPRPEDVPTLPREGPALSVTANQLTLLRLFLLPLPVAMIYREGVGWKLAALVVFVGLGLTDALDGILARRHGATPLGALLDPIADKMFLVAAYVPAADLRILPTALVAVVFARELLVTALRGVAIEQEFLFRTSRVAKLKTSVQMAGAGFVMLIWLFPRGGAIGPMLATAALASLAFPAASLLRGRVPGWKAVSGAILITAIAVSRALLGPGGSIAVIGVAILGITLYAGAEYAWRMRRVLARRVRRTPIEGLRLVALSLVVPLFLFALDRPSPPAVLVMGLLAAELAQGGLAGSRARPGTAGNPAPDLVRSAIQGACGFVLLATGAGGNPASRLPVLAALVYTLGDATVRSIARRSSRVPGSAPLPSRSRDLT